MTLKTTGLILETHSLGSEFTKIVTEFYFHDDETQSLLNEKFMGQNTNIIMAM